ncbi:MAG: hypothetical protein HRU70_00725 [Phycisphaeraceae bacterium]|nr:MAG: hypothetical protein HRU70_00725 [Phycisphaeraceae bacterium]
MLARSVIRAAAAAFTLAAPLAHAQSVGPDVIVGELYEVENYTSAGPIDGLRAYAVGTISCNVGDQPLLWISNTNQHPVISQNMYRIHNGRFQQIGQAWLKHGFCALQGSVCGSCTPNPDGCPALGVGCSDPYSAGLNGSQSGLGPKHEVNAATGAFPYPYNGNATGNATLRKRLQVKDADLALPGALYFVSSIYIAADDAAAGNAHNNQSYRRITVDPNNKNIALTGTTQRTKPAIFAWRDHGLGPNTADPNVILSALDVPGDGRFWIGAKATDLGNGRWRYDYAVQNLTSDRSARAFSVPLPLGATISTTGFSDVDYHSGEPYNNNDWPATLDGSTISWSTVAFNLNPNANALRWDTIYNFWFECDIPPAGGQVSLALFKPGTPAAATVNTIIPSPDGVFRPYNDSCALAATISTGATPFSNVNATTDGPAEPGPCTIAAYDQIGADIWYTHVPACSGTLSINTCGTAFDTKIAVYAGCPTGPGQALACNDDADCGLASRLTLQVTGGSTYWIRVGGFQAATGSGTLTLSGPNCGPAAPLNDSCFDAQWAADGVTITASTAYATNDGTASCGSSSTSPDVWFAYRPQISGSVAVQTCGSGYDTVLSAYSGACGSLTQIACNDDTACNGNGLVSRVTFNATAGSTYLIRLAGYNGATGAYALTVQGGGGVVPPTNDTCANRSGISLGLTPFSTFGAATDGPAHNDCGAGGLIYNDIWFNYPAQCDGLLRVSTCDSPFDSRIAVYLGSGCDNLPARLLACNDNADGCGTGSSVTVPVSSGNNYTIRVGGSNPTVRGTAGLLLECINPCRPDFNRDGFLDFFDLDAFVLCFEGEGCPTEQDADYNDDGFVDFFDLDAFVLDFEAGC